MEWLQEEKSFTGLLSAFFYPDLELTRLITELCTEGEILLQPHVLMAASCALRLREEVRHETRHRGESPRCSTRLVSPADANREPADEEVAAAAFSDRLAQKAISSHFQ